MASDTIGQIIEMCHAIDGVAMKTYALLGQRCADDGRTFQSHQ